MAEGYEMISYVFLFLVTLTQNMLTEQQQNQKQNISHCNETLDRDKIFKNCFIIWFLTQSLKETNKNTIFILI